MIICGDALTELKKIPDKSINCCITSPPFWGLRDYGIDGQLGLEHTPEEYTAKLVEVFREVKRVLRKNGTLWLNLGDSYASTGGERIYGSSDGGTGRGPGTRRHDVSASNLKPKDLIGIPWRVAFALQADGWWLRSDIIWSKTNPMPESVDDRPTRSHEYIFLLSKSEKYYYDRIAIIEPGSSSPSDIKKMIEKKDRIGGKHKNLVDPRAMASSSTNIGRKRSVGGIIIDKQRGHSRRHAGFNARWDAMTKEEQCSIMRNKRSVWTIATQPFSGTHYATFPTKLIEPMIKASCPAKGTVLDPFLGTGTTGLVALRLGREFIGIELNPKYCDMAKRRIYGDLYSQEPVRL